MIVKEALAILKPTTNDEKGLKDAYRKACLKYHPDHGGDEEMMKLVNLAYDTLSKMDTWWTPQAARQAAQETPLTEILKRAWDQIKHLQGIKVELIGTWLWVSGSTYQVKNELKDAGFKFSKNKCAWYFHSTDYRKRSKEAFSMDQIRVKFGAEDLESEGRRAAIAQ